MSLDSASEMNGSETEEGLSEWSSEEEMDPNTYFVLAERVRPHPSIDSIKMKINDKPKGPRQIYGEIKVDLSRKGKCIYLFHRHASEAQPVPKDDDDDDGFHLHLCGPTHCLDAEAEFDTIKVNIYREGAQLVYSGEFILDENMIFGNYHMPFRSHIDLPENLGRMTLCYTKVECAMHARFQFHVMDGEEVVSGDLAVIGTIKAKYVFSEESNSSWMCIVDSRNGAVKISNAEPIPLPRSLFLLPVQVQSDGNEDTRRFAVAAHLQVVKEDIVYSIKGQVDVVLVLRSIKFGSRNTLCWRILP